MKISKFMKTVKRKSRLKIIHVIEQNCMFVSNGVAIYKTPDLPDIEDRAAIKAMFDIDRKLDEKILITETTVQSEADVFGINMQDGYVDTVYESKPYEAMAIVSGKMFSALQCADGELIFWDRSMLEPIADAISESGGYIQYGIQKVGADSYMVMVYDGFTVLAAIAPVRFLDEKYIQGLSDFLNLCRYQFGREYARKKAAETEPEEEAEESKE